MQIPQHPSTSHPSRDEQSLLSTQKRSLASENKIHLEVPFTPFLTTPPRLRKRKHLDYKMFLPFLKIVKKMLTRWSQVTKKQKIRQTRNNKP
jgi:hypothetical protein